MSANNPKNTKNPPHSPGQTEGSRKGFDDQHASQSKSKQPHAPQPSSDAADETPIATFDEGERGPAHIESAGQSGLRTPAPIVSADPKAYDRERAAAQAEATMPPGEGRDPKRKTM